MLAKPSVALPPAGPRSRTNMADVLKPSPTAFFTVHVTLIVVPGRASVGIAEVSVARKPSLAEAVAARTQIAAAATAMQAVRRRKGIVMSTSSVYVVVVHRRPSRGSACELLAAPLGGALLQEGRHALLCVARLRVGRHHAAHQLVGTVLVEVDLAVEGLLA